MGFHITPATEKIILEQVKDVLNQLLTEEFESTFSKDIINIYNVVLNTNNSEILFNKDTVCMMVLTRKIYDIPGFTFLRELVFELEKKMVRFNALGSECGNIESYNMVLSRSTDVERFLPKNDEFKLPPQGKVTNLTVRRPDHTGKILVRELIIDSQGYVTEEVDSYYQHEREEDASKTLLNAFSSDLEKVKDDYIRTDDIIDAEKNCNGQEQYATK